MELLLTLALAPTLSADEVDYTLSLEAKCTLHPELGGASSCKVGLELIPTLFK